MSDQLYTFAEVILNYNLEPCVHYNKHFMPLYLTCKTFYNKYLNKKSHVFYCDICYFREIICPTCQLHNTKTCIECKCFRCNISGNLTGCLPIDGICDVCLISLKDNVLAYPLLFGRKYRDILPKIGLEHHKINIHGDMETPWIIKITLPSVKLNNEKGCEEA